MSEPADDRGGQPAERRVSRLAVGSLLASLACVPPMGFVGAGLGGLSLWRIARARGTLGGRSPALAAVFLGLVSSLLWTALAIGTASSLSRLEVYAPALRAVAARDHAALADSLTTEAHASIDPARLAEFADSIERDHGGFRRLARGLAESFEAFDAIRHGDSALAAGEARYPRERLGVFPARFEHGWAAVVVATDPDLDNRMASGATRLSNLGVARDDGSIEWLAAESP